MKTHSCWGWSFSETGWGVRTLRVRVLPRGCLSIERGMFTSIPAGFLAPIVPFVLYYLRSGTRLLLRTGDSKVEHSKQRLSPGCAPHLCPEVSPTASRLLQFAFSQLGSREFATCQAKLQRSRWKRPLLAGMWAWSLFSFLVCTRCALGWPPYACAPSIPVLKFSPHFPSYRNASLFIPISPRDDTCHFPANIHPM